MKLTREGSGAGHAAYHHKAAGRRASLVRERDVIARRVVSEPSPLPENKPEQPQIDKFRDLARELEADEDEKHFEDSVKRIAKSEKPKDDQSPAGS